MPAWIRRAIQLGLPSAAAVRLVDTVGLSRQGAMRIATTAGHRWEDAQDLISSMGADSDVLLSAADSNAVEQWAPE